jgi:hypothetical protein
LLQRGGQTPSRFIVSRRPAGEGAALADAELAETSEFPALILKDV